MLGLFTRDFENLDEGDLRDLIEARKVREHIQLDYKQEPYPLCYAMTCRFSRTV